MPLKHPAWGLADPCTSPRHLTYVPSPRYFLQCPGGGSFLSTPSWPPSGIPELCLLLVFGGPQCDVGRGGEAGPHGRGWWTHQDRGVGVWPVPGGGADSPGVRKGLGGADRTHDAQGGDDGVEFDPQVSDLRQRTFWMSLKDGFLVPPQERIQGHTE